jgi:hypothetical protein
MKMILRRFARWISCAAGFAVAGAMVGVAFSVLLSASAFAAPIGYSVRSDGDDNLYRIDLGTGAATSLGPTGFAKIEALTMSPAGELFGVNPATAQLVKCAITNGACTSVGALTNLPPVQTNAGLAFASNGTLYLAMNAATYVVNPADGATYALGVSGAAISGLGAGAPRDDCTSGLYAIGGNSDQGKFFCVNTTTGAATQLGTLTGVSALDGGLDGDAGTGLVWGITNNNPAQIYSVTPASLAVSNIKPLTINGVSAGGFESLAVVRSTVMGAPAAGVTTEVPTMSTFALAVLITVSIGAGAFRLRKQRC